MLISMLQLVYYIFAVAKNVKKTKRAFAWITLNVKSMG